MVRWLLFPIEWERNWCIQFPNCSFGRIFPWATAFTPMLAGNGNDGSKRKTSCCDGRAYPISLVHRWLNWSILWERLVGEQPMNSLSTMFSFLKLPPFPTIFCSYLQFSVFSHNPLCTPTILCAHPDFSVLSHNPLCSPTFLFSFPESSVLSQNALFFSTEFHSLPKFSVSPRILCSLPQPLSQ